LTLGVGSSTNSTTFAGYFDGTYEFVDNWYFDAGLRYSHDEVNDAYYIGITGAPIVGPGGILTFPTKLFPVDGISGNHLSPRAVLRWTPDENSSVYASVSSGYKAAVLNVGCGCSTAGTPARPEDLLAYEVGYKYSGDRFSGGISGFYYDYRHLQVAYYTFEAGTVINASRSRIDGIEAQGTYQVFPDLVVNGNLAYLEAIYASYANDVRYVNGPGIFTTQVFDGSGLTMQRSPKWSGNAGFHYTRDVGFGALNFSGNVSYTSKVYFDPASQYSQTGYGLLSLRLEWKDPSDHFTLAAYGNNITNTKYLTTVGYNIYGGVAFWGAPATWGLSLRADY
jgi:iron complex outermembrane receptor protein